MSSKRRRIPQGIGYEKERSGKMRGEGRVNASKGNDEGRGTAKRETTDGAEEDGRRRMSNGGDVGW